MPSMQRIQIIGHAGQHPVSKMTQTKDVMARISVAVNGWDGEQEVTSWYSVTCFGKTASRVIEKAQKGSLLYVEGDLSVVGAEGNSGEARWFLNIKATRVLIMERNDRRGAEAPPAKGSALPPTETQFIDDDLPF
jgi:single-strand DNA-binding protein